MSAISSCLMRRMDARLIRRDGKPLEGNAHGEISDLDDRPLAGENGSEREEVFVPSLSGLELDVFQVVTDVSNVSTLAKLCQVSSVLRDLVHNRTRGLMNFLVDMSSACENRSQPESGSMRHRGGITFFRNQRPSIFAELQTLANVEYLGAYATMWKTMIGSWDVWVYLDGQDYVCVTAMKLMAGGVAQANENSPDMHAKFCVLHFPRGVIVSCNELMRVLLSHNFNVCNGGRVSGHVFEIYPYDLTHFHDMAMHVDGVDLSDLRGRSAEVLKMHRWLRSPHLLRTDRMSSPQKMKIYRWRWIPESSAYLVTFRYFSEVQTYVKLVYAYIKCMEHAPEIDFVWIFTTHNVQLVYANNTSRQAPEPGVAIMDIWKQSPGPNFRVPRISITTRYNVGHYHNLVYLLFDYNWGMRETHDIEAGILERSFYEDNHLDPAPAGYDEDGWPTPAAANP
jgi:hypothetical protein